MNANQQEYFIYRIITGKVYYKNFCFHNPDSDLVYKSSIVYNKTYEKCENKGVYNDDDCLSILIDSGIWSETLEKRIKIDIYKELNELKLNLYETGNINSINYQIILNKIDSKIKEIGKLHAIRNSLACFTCAGISSYMKCRHIIKWSTFKSGKPYKWKYITPEKLMEPFNNTYISEEVIREIARSQKWTDIWFSSKATQSPPFSLLSTNLSSDQKRLILWSKLYDNIRESENPPSELVINNDYMLDGWLYKQKKEEAENVKEKIKISSNDKINNSSEVFVMVSGTNSEIQNKIKQIKEMNDFESDILKRSRVAKIKQNGNVRHQDFSDVKRDLGIELTNMQRQRMRNGR